MTCMEPRVEVALRHLGHVELVQELALVTFLAQTTQPVLAYNRPVASNVSEWATRTLVTVHSVDAIVELAHSSRRF